MMAKYPFDPEVIAAVQAAIANWENEGGAVLPITGTPAHSLSSSKMPSKRSRKTDSTRH